MDNDLHDELVQFVNRIRMMTKLGMSDADIALHLVEEFENKEEVLWFLVKAIRAEVV